jgi:hypothetical protein
MSARARGGGASRAIGSQHHCLMLAPDDVLPALDRWVDVSTSLSATRRRCRRCCSRKYAARVTVC